MPRYQDHIKKIQLQYFEHFFQVLQDHPDITHKAAWEITECKYDYDMFSTYGSFRVGLYHFNKKIKEQCQTKPSHT